MARLLQKQTSHMLWTECFSSLGPPPNTITWEVRASTYDTIMYYKIEKKIYMYALSYKNNSSNNKHNRTHLLSRDRGDPTWRVWQCMYMSGAWPCAPLAEAWLLAIAPCWPTFSSDFISQDTASAASRAVAPRPLRRRPKGRTWNPQMKLITAARWEIFIFTSHMSNHRRIAADRSPLQLYVVRRPLHGTECFYLWDVTKKPNPNYSLDNKTIRVNIGQKSVLMSSHLISPVSLSHFHLCLKK